VQTLHCRRSNRLRTTNMECLLEDVHNAPDRYHNKEGDDAIDHGANRFLSFVVSDGSQDQLSRHRKRNTSASATTIGVARPTNEPTVFVTSVSVSANARAGATARAVPRLTFKVCS